MTGQMSLLGSKQSSVVWKAQAATTMKDAGCDDTDADLCGC